MTDIQTVPERSGTSQNGQNTAPYADKEWLTINEAVVVFRHLGLPRTPEAIRKYCRQEKVNARSVAGPKGDQHMVEQTSIKAFVEDQLRVMRAASQSVTERPGTSRNIPVHSVTSRNVPEPPDMTLEGQGDLEQKLKESEERIKELERKNRDLEIDKEVRARMNDQLEKQNEKLFDQMTQERREAQELSRRFGQLEERVQHLQLAAPAVETGVLEFGDEGENNTGRKGGGDLEGGREGGSGSPDRATEVGDQVLYGSDQNHQQEHQEEKRFHPNFHPSNTQSH